MLNHALHAGFAAWAEMAEERQRTMQLIKAGGARLMKPALVAALQHWRRDWELRLRETIRDDLVAQLEQLQEAMAEARKESDAKLLAAAAEKQTLREQMARGQTEAEKREAEQRQEFVVHIQKAAVRRLLDVN